MRLSEKKSREIHKQEEKKSSKSECRYWLIVKLKDIKYKEDLSLLFIFLRLPPGFLTFNVLKRDSSLLPTSPDSIYMRAHLLY